MTRDWHRTLVSIPPELLYVMKRYQERNRMATFSGAVKTLLETHPAIAEIARELYDVPSELPR